jgi:hypothetical protein
MKYTDFAHDLRILAGILSDAADDLPEPMYDLPMSYLLNVAEAADVEQAAKALGVKVETNVAGHTSSVLSVDTVQVKFLYIPDDVMAAHKTRQDFAATMPAGWPGSVLSNSVIREQVES